MSKKTGQAGLSRLPAFSFATARYQVSYPGDINSPNNAIYSCSQSVKSIFFVLCIDFFVNV